MDRPPEDRAATELHEWIAERLQQERELAAREAVARHEALLRELHDRLQLQGSPPSFSRRAGSKAHLLRGTSSHHTLSPLAGIRHDGGSEHLEVAPGSKADRLPGATGAYRDADLPVENERQPQSPDPGSSEAIMAPVVPSGVVQEGEKSKGLSTTASEKKYKSARFQALARKAPENPVERLVESLTFEATSYILIFVQAFMVAVKRQLEGTNTGHHIEFEPDYGAVSYSEDAFRAVEIFFLAVFTIEMILRAADLFVKTKNSQYGQARTDWYRVAWQCSELTIIIVGILWVSETIDFPFNPMLLRLCRISRVLKLLPMLKNRGPSLDALYLLIRSMQASTGALFWSFILLLLLQMLIGLVLADTLSHFITDEANDIAVRRDIFTYWGTSTRTMLTMYEVTLGNWVPSCRTLMDNVSEWYALIYILYRCVFVFAVVKIITAVYIAETNRMIAGDDIINLQKQEQAKGAFRRKMMDLFSEISTTDSGMFTWDEFEAAIEDKLIKDWLKTMSIEVVDLRAVFQMLDDLNDENGDGVVEREEFISGLEYVRGPARALDVLKMQRDVEGMTGVAMEMNTKFDTCLSTTRL